MRRARTRSSDAGDSDDVRVLLELDREYQAAVARSDAEGMARILSEDFVLVTGSGRRFDKADLLREATEGKIVYDRQDDESPDVRVWGDTATITALLTASGREEGKPFHYRVWFTDTYVRTPKGWKYVRGQSGERLT